MMRKECEKNRLIRKELRKSKESEAIINYIDMLYSDEEAHGNEIREMWEKWNLFFAYSQIKKSGNILLFQIIIVFLHRQNPPRFP